MGKLPINIWWLSGAGPVLLRESSAAPSGCFGACCCGSSRFFGACCCGCCGGCGLGGCAGDNCEWVWEIFYPSSTYILLDYLLLLSTVLLKFFGLLILKTHCFHLQRVIKWNADIHHIQQQLLLKHWNVTFLGWGLEGAGAGLWDPAGAFFLAKAAHENTEEEETDILSCNVVI